jgi:hypothetical protein
LAAQPGEDFGQPDSGLDKRRETVLHIGKILFQVPNDFAALPKRSQDINETKHLHFEMFIPHGERHHALIKTGFAKKGFGVPINQLENLFAAPRDLLLESIVHTRKITPWPALGKAEQTLTIVTGSLLIALLRGKRTISAELDQ